MFKIFRRNRDRRTFLLQEWHNGSVEIHQQDDYGYPVYLGTYWLTDTGGAGGRVFSNKTTSARGCAQVLQTLQRTYHDPGLELSLGGQADCFGNGVPSYAAWREVSPEGCQGVTRDVLQRYRVSIDP